VSRLLLGFVVVLAFVAAGCGGGGGSSSSETTTTTETTTQTTTQTTTEAAGSTTTTDLSKLLGDKDCQALIAAGATVAQAFSGASGSTDASDKQLQGLVSKVPDAIKGDVDTLAKWYASYAAKLKAIGIKSGQTPSASQLQQWQAAVASLGTQKVQAAAQHLDTWAKQNCTG